MIEHAIHLEVSSRAKLSILYFSDRETRWLFSYHYMGTRDPGTDPEIVNHVCLAADYHDGTLADRFELTMHVVIPSRLGKSFFAGMGISPGAKTYFEFFYELKGDAYKLVEICKGACERILLTDKPGLVKAIESPFPIPDRIELRNMIRVPFRTNSGEIAHFELPRSTRR